MGQGPPPSSSAGPPELRSMTAYPVRFNPGSIPRYRAGAVAIGRSEFDSGNGRNLLSRLQIVFGRTPFPGVHVPADEALHGPGPLVPQPDHRCVKSVKRPARPARELIGPVDPHGRTEPHTVHVPRRPYVKALPGIPTVFDSGEKSRPRGPRCKRILWRSAEQTKSPMVGYASIRVNT